MGLKVVTLVDRVDKRINVLRQSCDKFGLNLEIPGIGTKWINNAFKFRKLENYLDADSLHPNDVIMVVDAFDVVVNADSTQILATFDQLGADIVFSAEANLYFRQPELALQYWWQYPRQEESIYHFLNSGTFIGSVWALRSLLQAISTAYQVNFENDDQLTKIRSDQYLYSRFYVDHALGRVQADFSMRLDARQELFGCSGGRMCVKDWGRISEIQDFLFFKYERRMLKTFGMKATQVVARDLVYDRKTNVYRNLLTLSNPPVVHLPGTYGRFEQMLRGLSGDGQWSSWSWMKPFALALSFIALMRSLVNARYLKWKNKGVSSVIDIFPVSASEGKVKIQKNPEFRCDHYFPKDHPFTCK